MKKEILDIHNTQQTYEALRDFIGTQATDQDGLFGDDYGNIVGTIINGVVHNTRDLYFGRDFTWAYKDGEGNEKDVKYISRTMRDTMWKSTETAIKEGVAYIEILKQDNKLPILEIVSGINDVWLGNSLTEIETMVSLPKGNPTHTLITKYIRTSKGIEVKRNIELNDKKEEKVDYNKTSKTIGLSLPEKELLKQDFIPIVVFEFTPSVDHKGESIFKTSSLLLENIQKSYFIKEWIKEYNVPKIFYNAGFGTIGGENNDTAVGNEFNKFVDNRFIIVNSDISTADPDAKNPYEQFNANPEFMDMASKQFTRDKEDFYNHMMLPSQAGKERTQQDGTVEFDQSKSNEIIGITRREQQFNEVVQELFYKIKEMFTLELNGDVNLSTIKVEDSAILRKNAIEQYEKGISSLDETRAILGLKPITEFEKEQIEIKENEKEIENNG